MSKTFYCKKTEFIIDGTSFKFNCAIPSRTRFNCTIAQAKHTEKLNMLYVNNKTATVPSQNELEAPRLLPFVDLT